MTRHYLVETKLGVLGLAWNEEGLLAVQLPEKNAKATEAQLLRKLNGPSSLAESLPPSIRELSKKAVLHFSGKPQDFSQTKIAWNTSSDFSRAVYKFCLEKLGPGQTATYGEVARAVGKPKSARAVGMVMGKNPMPLVVPCHRVLSASKNNRLCGFSAFGGVETKQKILALEGVSLL